MHVARGLAGVGARGDAAAQDRVQVGGVGDVVAHVVVAEAVLEARALDDVLEHHAARVGQEHLRDGGGVQDRVDRARGRRAHALFGVQADLDVALAVVPAHHGDDRPIDLHDGAVGHPREQQHAREGEQAQGAFNPSLTTHRLSPCLTRRDVGVHGHTTSHKPLRATVSAVVYPSGMRTGASHWRGIRVAVSPLGRNGLARCSVRLLRV